MLTVARRLEDIAAPIRNEISRAQDCKAVDMLRFLFSFCDTRDDAGRVEPKDEELGTAFAFAQELANEPDTLLRKNLNLAWVVSANVRSRVA